MPHRDKGIRCQYDPGALQAAVDAVKSGKMSVRKAAKMFKVPKLRSTTMFPEQLERVEGQESSQFFLWKWKTR